MGNLSLNILIIELTINDLNISIKRKRLAK
jgi:hypothetical protein